MTNADSCATINLAFAGVAHLVERDLAKVEVASSSLVARSKNKTPSEGMGFCFWNAAGRFELTASTCAKRVKSRGEAGFLRMAMPFAGCREASSSLVARSKKERHPHGCLSFLEQHFCYAKVTACGRVIEREWGNPSKVPPSHSPFLAVGGSADNKTCGQSQKRRDTHSCVSSFWELHFCYAKVVACGRMTEREWGNPSKVPPSHSPFLAVSGKTRCLDRRACEVDKNAARKGGVFVCRCCGVPLSVSTRRE